MSSNSLFHAVLGFNQTAFNGLDQASDFESSIIKAQLLISLGKAEDAITLLDGTKQETPYQKWHGFQMMINHDQALNTAQSQPGANNSSVIFAMNRSIVTATGVHAKNKKSSKSNHFIF